MPRLLLATLIVPIQLLACAGESSSTGNASPSSARQSGPTVRLASLITIPPAQSGAGEVWRGAMSWQAPAHWKSVDASGRPFVAGEYQLPGHSEVSPAGCMISNGQKPNNKTPEELRSRAEKDARRTDLKSPEGKSVYSAIRISKNARGRFEWIEGRIEGNYVDDGTFIAPRDPALIVEGYAARTGVPALSWPSVLGALLGSCEHHEGRVRSHRSVAEHDRNSAD